MDPRAGNRQRGAALAFVLALLVIIGILVGLTWRTIRSNNSLAAMDRGDAQARLLALAGADYAVAKVGPPGPTQDLGYASEGLHYSLDDSGRAFDLTVRTHGLFARARSIGKTDLPRPGRSREYPAILGQLLDLGKLPALGLLNHEGNMVLAGNAQVTGPVMLWRGDIRKATDYNVRWTGKAGHSGAVWDSTAPAWKLAVADFRRADAWMKAQEDILAARDFSKDTDYDSGMVKDLLLPDSAVIADSVMRDTRILADRVLRIGTGTKLSNCKLVSRRVIIEGDASLERTLVYAARTIHILGGRILGGQFLAGDSIRIATGQPLQGYPVFYAQGRMSNRGKPDSAAVGAVELVKTTGEGLFFSACKDHSPYDQEVRLSISPGSHLAGLLFTPCYARMEGSLEGSLICHNLKFEYKGTIWLGHLKDGQINAMSGRKVIPAPLLFPGFPPAAFAGRGP
ncbi:MAG: hypothetical protein JWO30_3773 [Fibrobacteres bacterium]|nr:hypothetical protein [Fibrobacterota bacterium]